MNYVSLKSYHRCLYPELQTGFLWKMHHNMPDVSEDQL